MHSKEKSVPKEFLEEGLIKFKEMPVGIPEGTFTPEQLSEEPPENSL